MSKNFKVAVHVPATHTDVVRQAIGDAGGGRIGEYSHCTFTIRGTGSYKGSDSSNPFNGTAGQLEFPEEDRIEVTVKDVDLESVVAAIKSVHPYEEPTIDIYPLVEIT
jgi:hypothetical protein